ncbi:MAG: hypothetical protein ABIS59_03615 [Candidatus Saccharibacteria bacterium]
MAVPCKGMVWVGTMRRMSLHARLLTITLYLATASACATWVFSAYSFSQLEAAEKNLWHTLPLYGWIVVFINMATLGAPLIAGLSYAHAMRNPMYHVKLEDGFKMLVSPVDCERMGIEQRRGRVRRIDRNSFDDYESFTY